jgi:hypothetical protein
LITFHDGWWPYFQLAFLALFSVGVNNLVQCVCKLNRPKFYFSDELTGFTPSDQTLELNFYRLP